MAPAPAPTTAPAPAPAVGVENEGARDQNNIAMSKSEDTSTGGVKDDGDLPIPCSESTSSAEVAPKPMEEKGGDTTESSSSFRDMCSRFGDEADGGEPEVSSHALASTDDEGSSLLPIKKVTAEWRNTVSSQVSKYDRELALIEKEKERQQAASKTNGSLSDAMLIGKDHRNCNMKRRKRKRHEDIADTSLYIKKHQILSHYYDKQNKGAETDSPLLDDDCNSPVDCGITGGLDIVALLDAEDDDVIFEQVSLKAILSKIDGAQSQVHFLVEKIIWHFLKIHFFRRC